MHRRCRHPRSAGVGGCRCIKQRVHLDACIDGAIVPGQPELVDVGASAYACIDGAIVPGQPEVVNVGASAVGNSGVCGDGKGEGEQGLGMGRTPVSAIRPHGLEQAELVARGIVTEFVEPALLVGGGGDDDSKAGASRSENSFNHSRHRSERKRAQKELKKLMTGANVGVSRGDDDGCDSRRSVVSDLSDRSCRDSTLYNFLYQVRDGDS